MVLKSTLQKLWSLPQGRPLKEGLPLGNARNVRFSLTGPINWSGGTVQVKVTVNTAQEGCHAIADAFVEKRAKARGPGHLHGMKKVTRAPTTAYNIEE